MCLKALSRSYFQSNDTTAKLSDSLRYICITSAYCVKHCKHSLYWSPWRPASESPCLFSELPSGCRKSTCTNLLTLDLCYYVALPSNVPGSSPEGWGVLKELKVKTTLSIRSYWGSFNSKAPSKLFMYSLTNHRQHEAATLKHSGMSNWSPPPCFVARFHIISYDRNRCLRYTGHAFFLEEVSEFEGQVSQQVKALLFQ